MKRVLITGGAGFIGSHMANRLLETGHDVVIIDNESTGIRDNVPKGVQYIRGDVRNPDDLARAFSLGIDAVFHIAGQASTALSFDDPLNDLSVNIVGTIQVLQKCIEYRVPRLLYASSMTCYGHPAALPIKEEMPCRPISYYGITKYAAERYVHSTALRNDLDFPFQVTSFRMFNVYGERQRLDNPYQGVMGIFIGNVIRGENIIIYGDGEQSRDFVYIGDVVDAWMNALDNPMAYGEVFNLGTGSPLSINQLVDTVLASFGKSRTGYPIKHEPERPGDQRHMVADITKAKTILAWHPRFSLEEGLHRTVQWALREWKKQR
jgi:UDP-glucose 4-epimerase